MRVNKPVTLFTSLLVLAGVSIDATIASGWAADDGMDHSVPRVPILLSTATSGPAATSTIITHASLTTGDQISMPPREHRARSVQEPDTTYPYQSYLVRLSRSDT